MQAVTPSVGLTQTRRETLAREALKVVAASAFIAVCARIQAPGPIPFTMQTFAVLLVAGAMGRVRATAAVLAYLLEGAAGLPVFAGGSAGLAYFMGPTGGYLVGFIPAAFFVGWLSERMGKPGVVSLTGLFALGHALIFLTGFAWLAASLGAEKAMAVGVLPFVVTGVLKSALAAVATPAGRRILGPGR